MRSNARDGYSDNTVSASVNTVSAVTLTAPTHVLSVRRGGNSLFGVSTE